MLILLDEVDYTQDKLSAKLSIQWQEEVLGAGNVRLFFLFLEDALLDWTNYCLSLGPASFY